MRDKTGFRLYAAVLSVLMALVLTVVPNQFVVPIAIAIAAGMSVSIYGIYLVRRKEMREASN